MSSRFTRKQSVDLAAPAVRVSRIRRDPPPPAKVVTIADIKQRDTRNTAIGIVAVALALIVLLMALNNAAGWSLSRYKIVIEEKG